MRVLHQVDVPSGAAGLAAHAVPLPGWRRCSPAAAARGRWLRGLGGRRRVPVVLGSLYPKSFSFFLAGRNGVCWTRAEGFEKWGSREKERDGERGGGDFTPFTGLCIFYFFGRMSSQQRETEHTYTPSTILKGWFQGRFERFQQSQGGERKTEDQPQTP